MPKTANDRQGPKLGNGSVGRMNKVGVSGARQQSADLWEILGRFDQALSFMTVCQQSLAAKESPDVGDEEEVLREGIHLLRRVHQDLDRRARDAKLAQQGVLPQSRAKLPRGVAAQRS